MERSNTALLNGSKATAGEEELTKDSKSGYTGAKADILTEEQPTTVPTRAPDAQQEKEIETTPPESPRKKRPIAIILAVLGVGTLAAGSFGYRWWQYGSTHQETDNATVVGHIHQVSTRINGTVATVAVSDNQLVHKGDLLVKLDTADYSIKVQEAQAALDAAQRQAQAAQANIALASETAEASATTAQGDVSGAQAAISTARSAVDEAQSGIPAAQAAVEEAQAGIRAAQAQLPAAEANLQKTQADYNRYNSLYSQGAVPKQQLETSKAAYQVALSQKNAAEQGVRQAQAKLAQVKIGVTTAEAKLAQAKVGVASAEAKLAASQGGLQQATAKGQQTQVNRSQYSAALAAQAQSQAALKDAQQQLSYTNITAPSDGLIGRKSVEVGQRVQPGQPLMAIVSNDLWVVANFKETQLEKMRQGEPAEIKLDAFPHHPFKAHLESISPASGAQFSLLPPDNATGNFTKVVQRIPVKLVFEPQSIQGYESRISPGMSAEVSVEVK